MNAQLAALVFCALLSLLLAVLTIGIHFARYGGKMIRGNRDDFPPLDGLAARVVRAHRSLNEALLPYAVIAIAVLHTHPGTRTGLYAAVAFSLARLAHAGLYLAGATPWRSLSYYAGLIATLVLASQLLP
jgi:uncharacterized MAPEG superfamily protein